MAITWPPTSAVVASLPRHQMAEKKATQRTARTDTSTGFYFSSKYNMKLQISMVSDGPRTQHGWPDKNAGGVAQSVTAQFFPVGLPLGAGWRSSLHSCISCVCVCHSAVLPTSTNGLSLKHDVSRHSSANTTRPASTDFAGKPRNLRNVCMCQCNAASVFWNMTLPTNDWSGFRPALRFRPKLPT